jgi:hypothetical protein
MPRSPRKGRPQLIALDGVQTFARRLSDVQRRAAPASVSTEGLQLPLAPVPRCDRR